MRTGTSKDTSLEALRGLAALNVVAGHFLLTFFPYLGNYLWNSRTITQRVVSQRFEFESWLGAAPFTILFNGTFPVCIFFVLSGYVLSWKFIEQGDHAYLRASALKRFPRLVAPVFASVLFAWALLTLGVMRTTEAAAIGAASFLSEAYNQPVSLLSALWIGAIGAPLLGQTTINVPLWTIKIELLGSFYCLQSMQCPAARALCLPWRRLLYCSSGSSLDQPISYSFQVLSPAACYII